MKTFIKARLIRNTLISAASASIMTLPFPASAAVVHNVDGDVRIAYEKTELASTRGRVVLGGDVHFWPLAARSIDTFTAFDVLEHIPDDQAAMANLFNTLKPGGRLILSVPAYQWLWSQHDELMHHQRRYLARDISSLARSAGFNIDYISYHNCILFPVVVFFRLISRIFDGRVVVDENRPLG